MAGGGNASNGPGDKPWLNEAVPELFKDSADDVCLGAQKVLCVILFSAGKPSDAQFNALKDIRREYDNKINRGMSFKFMWIDEAKQG